jgi:hypothetical protein
MKLIMLTAAVFFFGPFCRHAGTRGRRDAPGARSSAAPAGSRSEELLLYRRRLASGRTSKGSMSK